MDFPIINIYLPRINNNIQNIKIVYGLENNYDIILKTYDYCLNYSLYKFIGIHYILDTEFEFSYKNISSNF